MYYQFHNSTWRGTSDILMGVTAVNACKNINGVHTPNKLFGLSDVSGGYTVMVNNKSRGMQANVRIMQHELSHAFGCHDQDGENHVCVKTQKCINNGGFDNEFNYELENIWCDNCKRDFDPYTYS